jgi:hypothetical protein
MLDIVSELFFGKPHVVDLPRHRLRPHAKPKTELSIVNQHMWRSMLAWVGSHPHVSGVPPEYFANLGRIS